MIGVLVHRAASGLAGWAARIVTARGHRARPVAKDSNQELRQQNLRLDAALHQMSQGLCMFDAERRLIVCNTRFADLFALPARLTRAGAPLREIIDYQIASGAYPGDDPEEFVADTL